MDWLTYKTIKCEVFKLVLISKNQLKVVQKLWKSFLISPVSGICFLVYEWKEHSPLQFNYHLHPPSTTHHMSQTRRSKFLIDKAKKKIHIELDIMFNTYNRLHLEAVGLWMYKDIYSWFADYCTEEIVKLML